MNQYLSVAVIGTIVLGSQWFNHLTQQEIKSTQTKIISEQNLINNRIIKINDMVSLLAYAPPESGSTNQKNWNISPALLEEKLAEIISKQMAKSKQVATSSKVEDNQTQEDLPTYEESQAAYEQVDQMIVNTIADNNWNGETALKIAQYTDDLTPEQREQLLKKFTQAFNSGEIKVGEDFVPPPLW